MNQKFGNYNYFLNILKIDDAQKGNPFRLLKKDFSKNSHKFSYLFGLYEDSLEFEVRCPICLGRVHNAVKPNSCIHIFFFFFLKKWFSLSQKCPVCRTQFDSFIEIDIKKLPKSYSQMNLFASY